MDMINKIINAFTLEGAIFNIVCSIIASILIHNFEKYFPNKKSKHIGGSFKNIINGIQSLCIAIGIILIIVYFLTYILKLLDEIISIDRLANLYIISLAIFVITHIIYSILYHKEDERSLSIKIEGIAVLVLFLSSLFLILLELKIVVELSSGLTYDEVNRLNDDLMEYWLLFFQLIMMSSIFLIFNKIVSLTLSHKS